MYIGSDARRTKCASFHNDPLSCLENTITQIRCLLHVTANTTPRLRVGGFHGYPTWSMSNTTQKELNTFIRGACLVITLDIPLFCDHAGWTCVGDTYQCTFKRSATHTSSMEVSHKNTLQCDEHTIATSHNDAHTNTQVYPCRNSPNTLTILHSTDQCTEKRMTTHTHLMDTPLCLCTSWAIYKHMV